MGSSDRSLSAAPFPPPAVIAATNSADYAAALTLIDLANGPAKLYDLTHHYVFYQGMPLFNKDGKYEFTKSIGQGATSLVFAAVQKVAINVFQKVAIKVFHEGPQGTMNANKEACILRELNHPNICILLDNYIDPIHPRQYLGFPLYPTTLRQEITKRTDIAAMNVFSLNELQPIGKQLFAALGYLKTKNIAHLDLKPSNIAFCPETDQVILIDFGLARSLDSPYDPDDILVTVNYRSPALLLRFPPNQKSDMWSMGCVLYELYTGKFLFDEGCPECLLHKIVDERGALPDHYNSSRVPIHDDEYCDRSKDKKIDPNKTKNSLQQLFFKFKDSLECQLQSQGRSAPREQFAKSLQFIGLLNGLLQVDHEKRLPSGSGHPFIINGTQERNSQ